jgi:hypothetical protein
VVFASGSPFTPLQREDVATGRRVTMHPAQANNAYVFPSVGYAAVLTQGTTITDEVKSPTRSLRASLPPQSLSRSERSKGRLALLWGVLPVLKIVTCRVDFREVSLLLARARDVPPVVDRVISFREFGESY